MGGIDRRPHSVKPLVSISECSQSERERGTDGERRVGEGDSKVMQVRKEVNVSGFKILFSKALHASSDGTSSLQASFVAAFGQSMSTQLCSPAFAAGRACFKEE